MNKILMPKGRKVTVEGTGVNLTSQSGLVATSKFLEQKQLIDMIKTNILIARGNNAAYQFYDIIEYRVLGIIGGGRSLGRIGEI